MGLAYLPLVAVMDSKTGPVINLYNAGTATASTPASHPLGLAIATDYPRSGAIVVTVTLEAPERFSIKLRIPSWSAATRLTVNGNAFQAAPGTYANIDRTWTSGDTIALTLDIRCRCIDAPRGQQPGG